MGFGKPFRAPPVRLGPHYRARQQRTARRRAGKWLGIAASAGLVLGLGSVPSIRAGLLDGAAGLGHSKPVREREFWSHCAEVRAAGRAPIYRGEPGYRSALDRDNDGIACEPFRG